MWKRFQRMLACPQCGGSLSLEVFDEHRAELDAEQLAAACERGLLEDDFARYIDAGLLTCAPCAAGYPVFHGLPVLLPYTTRLHDEFSRQYPNALQGGAWKFANRDPVPGERFVLDSFSTEWLAYDFDGVIWEMDYADHERRFLLELGDLRPKPGAHTLLEVGCGIGLTTEMAQRNFGVDAVGVDLSLAALRATIRHKNNPFLHYAQGSAFYLPFVRESFDALYSRGVLHHTYSTEKAFAALAHFVRPGGTAYLWVYGPRSIDDNAFRRAVFVAERLVRRALQGRDSGVLAHLLLPPLALAYMVFNWSRRRADPTIQPYNFRRALHAARDRFTPEFAHRHDACEVVSWFKGARFVDVAVVDWRLMPTADHDDYRRNTGVRGRKAADQPA